MGISEHELRAVGSRLRARRAATGQSQEQLAKAAGISRPYLSEIEQGRTNITLDTLYTLAACLNIEPVAILQGDPEPADG